MTARASLLSQTMLASTIEEVYAVPAGGIPTEITRLVFTNLVSSMTAVSLYHALSGAAFTSSNALILNKQISGNDFLTIESASEDTGITLRPGERLGASADTPLQGVLTIYGVTARTTVAPIGQRGRV